MTKADQVKTILDRTVKDITALKAICNDDGLSTIIDLESQRWLCCLQTFVARFKNLEHDEL